MVGYMLESRISILEPLLVTLCYIVTEDGRVLGTSLLDHYPCALTPFWIPKADQLPSCKFIECFWCYYQVFLGVFSPHGRHNATYMNTCP